MDTLLLDGVDLRERYGAVVSSWDDTPPEPRESRVEVPGRDGDVDLTDHLMGWPTFGDRRLRFTLVALDRRTRSDVVGGLTAFKRDWHGRRCHISYTGDPGYWYDGRLVVGAPEYRLGAWSAKCEATCAPYKSRGEVVYHLDAALGRTVNVPCGARSQCPVVEVSSRTLVNLGGQTFEFGPGASRNLDLWLAGGTNRLTVNGTPDYSVAVWADLGHAAWEPYLGMSLGLLAAAGGEAMEGATWSDAPFAGAAWDVLAGTWQELRWRVDATPPRADTYIRIEWEDL